MYDQEFRIGPVGISEASLGRFGYLADSNASVRSPMCVLAFMAEANTTFHWKVTHQRAFGEIKLLVLARREGKRGVYWDTGHCQVKIIFEEGKQYG